MSKKQRTTPFRIKINTTSVELNSAEYRFFYFLCKKLQEDERSHKNPSDTGWVSAITLSKLCRKYNQPTGIDEVRWIRDTLQKEVDKIKRNLSKKRLSKNLIEDRRTKTKEYYDPKSRRTISIRKEYRLKIIPSLIVIE